MDFNALLLQLKLHAFNYARPLLSGWIGDSIICISYNTGKSALPDIYARRPRASAYILHAFNYTIITYVCFIKFMKQDLCSRDGLVIPFVYKFIPKYK